MHWVVTPLVIAQWVSTPWFGALFSFITVFIYWSLNSIATEIENPFGSDANDLDAEGMQKELNRMLLLLMEPQVRKTPGLSQDLLHAVRGHNTTVALNMLTRRPSLQETWTDMERAAAITETPPKRTLRATRVKTFALTKTLSSKRSTTHASHAHEAEGIFRSTVASVAEVDSEDFHDMRQGSADVSKWASRGITQIKHATDPANGGLALRTLNEEAYASSSHASEGHDWRPEGNSSPRSIASAQGDAIAPPGDPTAAQRQDKQPRGPASCGSLGESRRGCVEPSVGASRSATSAGAEARHADEAPSKVEPPRSSGRGLGATRRLHASVATSSDLKTQNLVLPKYSPPRG